MLAHLIHAIALVRQAVSIASTPRSPKWPALERKTLRAHPRCAACGSRVRLNVHHIKPFHLFPDLELEPTNLIVLCMDIGRHCHLLLGHGNNFKCWNPDVVADAAKVLKKPSLRDRIVALAKQNRLQ